jgi:hypothetical protein
MRCYPVIYGYAKSYFSSSPLARSDWKAIPLKLDELEEIAEALSITPLNSFISISSDESIFDENIVQELERIGELINGRWYYDNQYLWSVEIQWFEPEQGLTMLHQLLLHLRDQREQTSDDEIDWDDGYEDIITELDDIVNILNKARQENRLFRISLSS